MPEAISVDWYGPYLTKQEFIAEARGWGRGTCALYIGVGSHNRINYIGLTETPRTRFYNHHKLWNQENVRFFLGEITTRGASGRRTKKASDRPRRSGTRTYCLPSPYIERPSSQTRPR